MATFLCTCGKRFQAKPELAGRRFKCTQCGAVVQVPDEEARTAPVFDDGIIPFAPLDAAPAFKTQPQEPLASEYASAKRKKPARDFDPDEEQLDPVEAQRAKMEAELENLPKAILKLQAMFDEMGRTSERQSEATSAAEAKLAKLDNPGMDINLGQFAKDMLKAGLLGGLLGSPGAGIAMTATDRVMNESDKKKSKSAPPKEGKSELEAELRKEQASIKDNDTRMKEARVFLKNLHDRKWAMKRVVPGRGILFRLALGLGYATAFWCFLIGSIAAAVAGILKEPIVAMSIWFVTVFVAKWFDGACMKYLVPALNDYALVYPKPNNVWRRHGRFFWLFAGFLFLFMALGIVVYFIPAELRERARRNRKAELAHPGMVFIAASLSASRHQVGSSACPIRQSTAA